MPVLHFDRITVDYTDTQGAPLRALDDVSLDVAEGQSVAIIGPSGCGKSTLLRLACGLASPTAGAVTVDGAPLTKPRRGTALILQDFGLLPWKTVLQNAELGLQIAGEKPGVRHRRALDALEQVDLTYFAHAYPNQLSGGMKQRLAIARALAQNADVLLMDEPLSALDALLRENLQDTLLQVWQTQRPTQILVTHSIEEAVYLGQRIVVMHPRPGRIKGIIENPEVGTPGWRRQDAFFQRCTQVRALLDLAQTEASEEVTR